MKKIIQIVLILIILLLFFGLYKFYFDETKNDKVSDYPLEKNENQNLNINDNFSTNEIKNLEYLIKLKENTKYEIKSNFSRIINKGNYENLELDGVRAKFTDEKNNEFKVYADHGFLRTDIYDSVFSGNVVIEYLDDKITSQNLSINFTKNKIHIYNQVAYNGRFGKFKTDNILLNLDNKNMEIYMNNVDEKVKFINKN